MRVDFFPRGNWHVSEPDWAFGATTQNELLVRMLCPHPQWVQIEREIKENPVDGRRDLSIMERCTVCGSYRKRVILEELSQEPFDTSIPKSGPWYERLYNLGNFVMLVRRFHWDKEVPPTFLTRIETPSGNFNTGIQQVNTLLFSPAALGFITDLEKMTKLGADRYAAYRVLKEGRKTKMEKDQMLLHARAMDRIVQEVGPESIAGAKALLEAEIGHETEEMRQYQTVETPEYSKAMEKETQEMEKQLEELKIRAQKRKSQKPK